MDRYPHGDTKIISRRAQIVLACTLSCWLGGLIAGTIVLANYSSTPSFATKTARSWPTDSVVNLDHSGTTLVVCLHPNCPCSKASIHELEIVLASCAKNRPHVRVLFYRPENKPDDWVQSSLWTMAANLSDCELIVDRGGREATKFGVTTSGHVMLYAIDGQLLFDGGITSGRGHEGISPARLAIIRILNNQPVTETSFPVFGCPI